MSVQVADLMEGFSIEMTGKDIAGLRQAGPVLPADTRAHITFLANETLEMRIAAARAVKAAGFVPVPHISARRIASEQVLHEFLDVLQTEGAADHVFAVGGDPAEPEGPYEDAAALIASGAF